MQQLPAAPSASTLLAGGLSWWRLALQGRAWAAVAHPRRARMAAHPALAHPLLLPRRCLDPAAGQGHLQGAHLCGGGAEDAARAVRVPHPRHQGAPRTWQPLPARQAPAYPAARARARCWPTLRSTSPTLPLPTSSRTATLFLDNVRPFAVHTDSKPCPASTHPPTQPPTHPQTNILFLENVLRHPEFLSGASTTTFIDRHPELFELNQKAGGCWPASRCAVGLEGGGPAIPSVDAHGWPVWLAV